MQPQITIIGVPCSRVTFRSVHEWEGSNWQVIFKVSLNGELKDYCRETKPGSMSSNAVEAWAEKQIDQYKLHSAIIERW